MELQPIKAIINLLLASVFFLNNIAKIYFYQENFQKLKKITITNVTFEILVIITKTFGLSQLIYFLQCCVMYPEDIIRVDRIMFKFLWNKKWDGKCPDRIQRQVLKNSYDDTTAHLKQR